MTTSDSPVLKIWG